VEKPQAYIVGAKRRGIYDVWRFKSAEQTDLTVAQNFVHSLQVSFIEVLPDEIINDRSVRSGLFPKLPADLFYPL
jgi:glycerol-3-phosphate responsive antiterminator